MLRNPPKAPASALAAALALAASFVSPAAQGYPDFHHSGSACRGATSSDAGRIDYVNSYGVRNESTSSTARIHCGIDLSRTSNSVPAAIDVFVIDGHATENITCRVSIFSETGTLVGQETQVSDPTYGLEEPQLLTFEPPNLGPQYFYNVRCDLPRTVNDLYSHVIAYKIVQATF